MRAPKRLSSLVLAIGLHAACASTAHAADAVVFACAATPGAAAVAPRIGFLGGLRDEIPDALIAPLRPSLWRIGHQFRGRIASGLGGAIARVERLGGRYKLVMSDLIPSWPAEDAGWDTFDWAGYESAVKRLVAEVGDRAAGVIWEPANEPDCNIKPIERYDELYAHAFTALRAANPALAICGPGFAFPTRDKYRAFLDRCRDAHVECNYLAWHFTSWDPLALEHGDARIGELRELIAAYPDQKIREIHCDEWGAAPGKPGYLHPGRAVVWFHYLEEVWRVDQACRANWGGADDFLGGLVTPQAEPYPVYHAYRWYAATRGQKRIAVTGGGDSVACLASGTEAVRELLVGSIHPGVVAVTVELPGTRGWHLAAQRLSAEHLDAPMAEAAIPTAPDVRMEAMRGGARITLPAVAENEAYRVVLTR